MAPRSVCFGVRSRKLSYVVQPFIYYLLKIYYLDLLRASKGMLSRWSRLHMQSFIIIISLLQPTAGHRPPQCLAISLDLRLLASSSCQPSCANRDSTCPEGVLHYVYLDAASISELVYPNGYRFYG
jgi:hypothetical protein